VNTLDEWAAAVCGELGLDPAALDPRLVLDLARDVAHGVARPAAPLTAYLLGVAVGQGRPPAESAALISRLAAQWTQAEGIPAEETPAEGALAKGTPAEETPAEGALAKGTPVERTRAEGTPVERTRAEGTPVERTRAEGAPVERTGAEGTPVERTRAEGAPGGAGYPGLTH
jgi:Domain of unknown function (DUF6457)